MLVGKPGVGKTSWAATSPNPGFAACESGHGDGLLSVAQQGVAYVTPTTLGDFEAICTGQVFKDRDTIVLDSLSAMVRTFIKDYAIAVPRRGPDSPKRKLGVPELDDYQTMAEITRRLLSALLDLDKNIVVTALEKSEKDENGAIVSIGPDLPGQLFLGAPALFYSVLYLKARPKFRVPGQPTSRYTEHYLVTTNDGLHVGKDRNNASGKAMLTPEEVFDKQSGTGSFTQLHAKIVAGYQAAPTAAIPPAVSNTPRS